MLRKNYVRIVKWLIYAVCGECVGVFPKCVSNGFLSKSKIIVSIFLLTVSE